MTADELLPVGFDPPTSVDTELSRLEPLGSQHNQADHAASMWSIEHVRSTPGYPDGKWPPRSGKTLEEKVADIRRHAEDFKRRAGLSFTVLDPATTTKSVVSTCIPPPSEEWDVRMRSWVRADTAGPRTTRRCRRTLARHRLALAALGGCVR